MSSIFQLLDQNITMQKLLITGAIIGALMVLGLISYCFLGADNPIEEACEGLIRSKTGVDLDFSPESQSRSVESENSFMS